MKKGDLKKQEILRTAETLFCKNGYETTSIQDILDVLNTSKGSFYHHYASKELLLEEICRQRAKNVAETVLSEIDASHSVTENLNRIISGFMPLSGEKQTFLMMILPVFDLPEGRQIRFGYAESLSDSFRSVTLRELIRGHESGDLYCVNPEHSADMMFLTLNDCWYRICLQILENEKKGIETDPSDLLRIIDNYRRTTEMLLSAPYGSLALLNLEELKFLTDQIHYHWKLHHSTIIKEVS